MIFIVTVLFSSFLSNQFVCIDITEWVARSHKASTIRIVAGVQHILFLCHYFIFRLCLIKYVCIDVASLRVMYWVTYKTSM